MTITFDHLYNFCYKCTVSLCVIVLERSSPVCGVVSVHTSRGVWGSGIVMQDDVIITCAHVIHNETGGCECFWTNRSYLFRSIAALLNFCLSRVYWLFVIIATQCNLHIVLCMDSEVMV